MFILKNVLQIDLFVKDQAKISKNRIRFKWFYLRRKLSFPEDRFGNLFAKLVRFITKRY